MARPQNHALQRKSSAWSFEIHSHHPAQLFGHTDTSAWAQKVRQVNSCWSHRKIRSNQEAGGSSSALGSSRHNEPHGFLDKTNAPSQTLATLCAIRRKSSGWSLTPSHCQNHFQLSNEGKNMEFKPASQRACPEQRSGFWFRYLSTTKAPGKCESGTNRSKVLFRLTWQENIHQQTCFNVLSKSCAVGFGQQLREKSEVFRGVATSRLQQNEDEPWDRNRSRFGDGGLGSPQKKPAKLQVDRSNLGFYGCPFLEP